MWPVINSSSSHCKKLFFRKNPLQDCSPAWRLWFQPMRALDFKQVTWSITCLILRSYRRQPTINYHITYFQYLIKVGRKKIDDGRWKIEKYFLSSCLREQMIPNFTFIYKIKWSINERAIQKYNTSLSYSIIYDFLRIWGVLLAPSDLVNCFMQGVC